MAREIRLPDGCLILSKEFLGLLKLLFLNRISWELSHLNQAICLSDQRIQFSKSVAMSDSGIHSQASHGCLSRPGLPRRSRRNWCGLLRRGLVGPECGVLDFLILPPIFQPIVLYRK